VGKVIPSSDKSFFSSSDSSRVEAFLDEESVESGEGGVAADEDSRRDS